MKYVAKQVGLIVAAAVMVTGLAGVSVSAHGGITHDNATTSVSSDSTVQGARDESTGHEPPHEKAEQLLKTKREHAKEHSYTERQKSCEARQKSIEKRAAKFATAAERHLGVFDKIFTRVQAFHGSKQLDVADYDTLVAAVVVKQSLAQTAVDALKDLNVTLDCDQVDPASSVATLKTGVADARTALKEYRTAIKDVVTALKGASTSQNTTETTEDN